MITRDHNGGIFIVAYSCVRSLICDRKQYGEIAGQSVIMYVCWPSVNIQK